MQPPPLTPEQCLYHDILAAVQMAEEADIDFDTIHKLILQTLAELTPDRADHKEYNNGDGCNNGFGRVSETVRPDAEANARLAAAAPEMFEALRSLENDARQMPDFMWQMVQNAVEKAGGTRKP
jgi:hypothetical protein